MTNVLIPTDFSLQSLDVILPIARQVDEKLNIFMFHAFDMPDSLADAMRRTGIRGHHNLVTEELRLKCRQVKALCPNVSNISFKLMFGTTVVAFQNFAEANNIQLIIYPEGYKFMPVVRESVNPDRMFLKSMIVVMREIRPMQQAETTPAQPAATYAAESELVLQ